VDADRSCARITQENDMPERVARVASEVLELANSQVTAIQAVTDRTHLLSLNARIEAAHAGELGRGFGVVAREVGEVSQEVSRINVEFTSEISSRLTGLTALGDQLVAQVRGTRLADLALNMIDIVDRNLYERSCDVRWWATDAAVVDVCAHPSEATSHEASRRLGVILDSYTVYLDLWVADLDGRVVAHGRPDRYRHVLGRDVSDQAWFADALATASGEDFAVADISRSPALGDELVATYSTAVRADGDVQGAPIGVLGIFFDWDTQAGNVVRQVRLADDERARTRCVILDSRHRVIASSDGSGILSEEISLDTASGTIGHYEQADGSVVGYALTPGYETYAGMGWYGAILQDRAQP
jgi:hypothetical protein